MDKFESTIDSAEKVNDGIPVESISDLTAMSNRLDEVNLEVEAIKEETPIDEVEKTTAQIIKRFENLLSTHYAFDAAVQMELLNRLPNMTNTEILTLFSDENMGLNDKINKILAPTIGIINNKQNAEIADKRLKEKAVSNNVMIDARTQNLSGINASVPDKKGILAGAAQIQRVFDALAAAMPATDNSENSK